MSEYIFPSKLITEPIVISGMSGRFPESDSTDEFANNLYNNIDLITDDNRRWPTELFGMNHRMGKLKHLDKLDSAFFGIHKRLCDTIEPHSRILLETTYEAIIDAGINPQNIRGSKTGVYIGYSSFGMSDGLPEDVHWDCRHDLVEIMLDYTGLAKCLFANRISFVFDLKGPSLVIDTACSSSLVAFDSAMNDLRLGKVERAIVGGTQVCLQAFTNQIFQATQVNSPDGIPKVWDEKADGYVRGESVFCFLLQRKSEAKRIYATVLNSGVNIDGHKKKGMFLPSTESQEQLMVSTYKEANIDPLKVTYFEAHATGTKAGDTQEAKAIYNAYCLNENREQPLPIGLLKSIIGHGEGASGGPAVVRVLLAYERECISANLHLDKLKTSIKPFCPPLLPVTENMKYTPGIAGVNNFGIGGVNAHLLLEPNYKITNEESLIISNTIPRIVNICSRTEEGFNRMCKWIEENPQKVSRDFLALLAETMRIESSVNTSGMPYRGSLFIKQLADNSYEYKKEFSVFTQKSKRPVWFVFPGLGGQWTGMAKALMPIKIFADRIEECHQILITYGLDLKHILLSDDKDSMKGLINKFSATTAIEMALFDVMQSLNITPDGIIGHSFGEIAVAYADECLTLEEALLTAYYRGVVVESDKQIPKGLMSVIGLSWNEAKSMCTSGVEVVCNNGKDTVVVSGLENITSKLMETIAVKDIFARIVDSDGIPLHSRYMCSSAQTLTQKLKEVIKNPKLRSKRWTSTAVIESEPKEELKYASAEYFVHNLISPVYFYNKLPQIPEDAIVIEVGPHGLFSRPIKDRVQSGQYISLMKKDSNDTNLDMFLSSIAKLYELGLNPMIENLYPKVEWPVCRGTQSISSLIEWDHSDVLFTKKYPDFYFKSTASDMNVNIDLSQSLESHLADHIIDGNVILPGVGYLFLAWQKLADYCARPWNEVPVVFENIQFRRPIFLSETDVNKIKVKYFNGTGDFTVEESGNVCCSGKVRANFELELNVQHMLDENKLRHDNFEVTLSKDDIYNKDFRAFGFDHGPKFQTLLSMRTNDFESYCGEVHWDGNWMAFMDGLLQSIVLPLPFRKLMVPFAIKSLRCDPRLLFEAIDANRVIQKEEDNDQDKKSIVELKEEEIEDQLEQGTFDEEQGINMAEKMFKEKNHICEAVLPYFVDVNTQIIVTYGVEVEGLGGMPVSRRTNTQDLRLESYEFIANEDLNAIEESQQKSVLEYIEVCQSLVIKIECKTATNSNKCDIAVSEEVLNKYLNDMKPNHILLTIFHQIYKTCFDENQNLNSNIISEIIDKNDLSSDLINQFSKKEFLVRPLLDIVSENMVPKKEIKVLEINSTNGLMAEEVDNHLVSFHIYPIDVNYTIAVNSVENISEEYKNKSFKLIEWKASDSSVFPSDVTTADLILYKDYYDLWQMNIEKHLQEAYDALVNNGFLLSIFRYQLTEPELSINQMNGKTNLKNCDLEKRIAEYLTVAKKVGFRLIGQRCDSIASKAVLFRKVSEKIECPKTDQIIEIKSNSMQWFDLLQQKLLEMKESEEKGNIWLIANNSSINGVLGLVNCLRLEPGGIHIRCILDLDESIGFPFNFREKHFSDILVNDLAINVLKNGKSGTYRHLTLPQDFDKKYSNEYFLNNTHFIDLSGLQWFDSSNLVPQPINYSIGAIDEKQIQCSVYMAGLNFKDVMTASGRISSGALSLFTDCLLGTDFTGRRCDTRERVMGFTGARSFGTDAMTREDLITTIPDHWSMEEAVTLLSTYNTIWYGLIERAHLKKGESILIHSGAGGVGQAAINVCKYYECDIYVTVGNEEKKKYLMDYFNIPENKIFSSRNIQFKYEIKRLTKGKGVDIVLNSLTDDKMDASIECVADSGRYLEIGKFELQMNKQMGTALFLRNISFMGIFIEYELFLMKESAQHFFKWIHENSMNGMIKPINATVFEAQRAKNAFQYMTTGKHIGKIVIKIRDEENERKPLKSIPSATALKTTVKTYFNPNKVYIITGGLGGFGLELVHWMLFLGARKFVLTSRYGVRTDYQKFILHRFNKTGEKINYFESQIKISTNDTNTIEGVKQLFSEAQQMAPIGGVFHLAVVLNDSLLENQSIDKFNETVDTKAKSFENLDKISRELNHNLDYFVVFSSVSCGKGNAGQTSYGFGNSLCERICENRRRDSLHGLAIQWGPIGDVGILSNTEMTALSAIQKQRINSCLETLDKFLQTNKTIVSCVMRANRSIQTGNRESKLANQIWQALGIDPKTTPNHLTLGEIGMESMFAVELQQGLEREYEIKITLNDVRNITIGMMKDFEAGKTDKIKKFAQDVKLYREKLSKIKFSIPIETHTRLNDVINGKPIYFLPPLEGIFASLEELAAKLNRPVIGLNRTKAMNELQSIEELSAYYTNLIKSLKPNDNFDIMGYFHSGLIATEMQRNGLIGKAIIIDMLSDIKLNEDILSEEYLLDMTLTSIFKELPEEVVLKMKRDIHSKPDIQSKVAKISEELKEFVGKGLVSKDLEEIFMNSYNSSKMFTNYMIDSKKKSSQLNSNIEKYIKSSRITGKLLIIKPIEKTDQSNEDLIQMIKSTYFWSQNEDFEEKVVIRSLQISDKFEMFDAIALTINKDSN